MNAMIDHIREPLQHFIDICECYKDDQFDVLEFQHAIKYSYLPPETSKELSIIQHNAHEDIEDIIYGSVGMDEKYREERRKLAIPLADKLITATIAEIERLENYTPYATPAQQAV